MATFAEEFLFACYITFLYRAALKCKFIEFSIPVFFFIYLYL